MSMLLITKQGELREAESLGLRLDLDFIRHVVPRLGFIAVRRVGAAHRMWLKPATVSQVALARLYQLLADERPERVVVTEPEAGALDVLLGPWRGAMQALGAQVAAAQGGDGDAFLRVPRKLEALRPCDPLAGFFGRWRERGGRAELKEATALIGRVLAPRHLAVAPRPLDGALAICSAGRGFATYDAAWQARVGAATMDCHRDYHYSKWAHAVYREALARGEPCLDDLDMLIGHPEGGRRRFRCRRLIVPITSRDGTRRLLAASVLDPGVDLRRNLINRQALD